MKEAALALFQKIVDEISQFHSVTLPSAGRPHGLRTMRSTNKPQFGVQLAADYGPKRST
jgi:hypothetical protein